MHLGAGRLRHCATFLRAANLAVLVTHGMGSFIWLVTSVSRPIGQKRRRRTGAKMWGRTRTKPRGSYRVWEDKPPEKRYVCMLLHSQRKLRLKRACLKLEIPF